MNANKLAVASVRVTYSDGSMQYAQFQYGSDMVACQTLSPSGGLLTAGELSREQVAKGLSDDVLGGDLGSRVCAELVRRGLAATWEYPGYIEVKVREGVFWSIGEEEGQWVAQFGESEGGVLGLPAKCHDVNAIANAIVNTIKL